MNADIVAILLPVMLCAIVFTYLVAINVLDRYGPPRKSRKKKGKFVTPEVDEDVLAELLERAERLNKRVANLEEIHRSHREVA